MRCIGEQHPQQAAREEQGGEHADLKTEHHTGKQEEKQCVAQEHGRV